MKNTRLIFFLAFILMSSCVSKIPSSEYHIYIPSNCELSPGQQISVSLSGTNIPADGEIKWVVDKGRIEPDNELTAIFTAPDSHGTVVIKVIVTSNNLATSTEETCEIRTASTNFAATIDIIDLETNPLKEEKEEVEENEATTVEPTPIVIAIEKDAFGRIAITELMANPCNEDIRYVNEYVELYNYSDDPVDVNGLYLMTTSQKGNPDRIVSWQQRFPRDSWSNNLVFNSTVIEPQHYAVIISPVYSLVKSKFTMPYSFPEGTVILTIEEGDRIGNKKGNILGATSPLDSLLLFEGNSTRIDKVISTYGLDPKKVNIRDLRQAQLDDLPLITRLCYSVQRRIPSGDDISVNWEEVSDGNPGSGPYD